MKPVALFGSAVFAIFLAAASASTFGFGLYERAWGRGGSLGVEAWLALVGALVAMGAFGISSAALHRAHTQRAGLMLGAFCALAWIALCWVIDGLAPASGAYPAFLLLIVVPALASFAGERHAG